MDGLEGLQAPGHTQASWKLLQARRPQAGRVSVHLATVVGRGLEGPEGCPLSPQAPAVWAWAEPQGAGSPQREGRGRPPGLAGTCREHVLHPALHGAQSGETGSPACRWEAGPWAHSSGWFDQAGPSRVTCRLRAGGGCTTTWDPSGPAEESRRRRLFTHA